MKLSARIKSKRLHLKITQEALGKLVGVSRAAVAQWEKDGGTAPTFDKMRVLSNALQCTVAELLEQTQSQDLLAPELASAALGDEAEVVRIQPQSWPYDLPVYPLDAIGTEDAHAAHGQMECYGLREESVEYCRRPPGVMGVPGAYVTYVPKAVLRRYAKGEALVVAPDRQVKPGDVVVLKFQSTPEDRVVSFLGVLISEADAEWVEIGHELPTPTNNLFLAKTVTAIHKVLTTAEIIGL